MPSRCAHPVRPLGEGVIELGLEGTLLHSRPMARGLLLCISRHGLAYNFRATSQFPQSVLGMPG